MFSLLKDGITQSLLQDYMMCPTRYRLSTELWAGPESEAMRTGSMAHDIIDKVRKGADVNSVLKSIPIPKSGEIAKHMIAVTILSATIPGYLKRYPVSKEKIIETEHLFDVKLGGFRLRGKIDSIRKSNTIGEMKFRGRISEDLEVRLALDWQSLFYLSAMYLETKKFHLKVFYDVIRVSGMKDCDLKSLYDKIQADIAVRPEYYYYRYESEFTESDILAFIDELKAKLTELWERKRWWKNQCACNAPYPCAFQGMCASGDTSGLIRKKQMFEELK